jgi:hypothetical protein
MIPGLFEMKEQTMKRPVFLIAALAALAGVGQLDAQPRDKTSKSTYDPSQIVCSRQREPGSRVLNRRICMPQRDWEAFRREQRQAIERAQTSRVHPTG